LKTFVIILFFILNSDLQAGSGNSYWLVQPQQTSRNLSSCVFTDTSYGWIAGDTGLVLNTTNGGVKWNTQSTGILNNIHEMFFLNRNIGYALAWELDATPPNYYGTKILSTTNGGANWNVSIFPDSNVFLNTVFFRDSLNGYIAGSGGKLYYSTDGGAQWINSEIDSGMVFGFPVEKIKFYDEDYGLAVGGAIDIAGLVWRSTNGGRTWRTIIIGPEPINDFLFLDKNNAIGVGGDFEYGSSNIKSFDAGSTWLYEEFQVFGIANTIAFRTKEEAWISLGIVDSFLVSTDGGTKWELTGTPQQSRIYDIEFPGERNGWAVGIGGVILKYNTAVISVNNINTGVPEKFILHQNYPNPFNPETIIRYEIMKTGITELTLYDIKGNEINKLVNELQTAGSYNIKLSGANLPSGVYYYKLSSGGYSETKKLVLLK